MEHVHLVLDHCNGAAATFTMFWVLLLLLLARRFMFSAFLTAALLLPSTGIVSVLCSFITIDHVILLLLLPLCARTILSYFLCHFVFCKVYFSSSRDHSFLSFAALIQLILFSRFSSFCHPLKIFRRWQRKSLFPLVACGERSAHM